MCDSARKYFQKLIPKYYELKARGKRLGRDPDELMYGYFPEYYDMMISMAPSCFVPSQKVLDKWKAEKSDN